MNRFRTVLFVVVGLLLAGLLLWLLRPSGAQPDSVADEGPAVTSAPGVLPAAPAAPQDAAAAVERSAAPAVAVEPEAGAATPDKTRLGFRGRCVAAETGLPLAGCTVEFFGWPGNSDLLAKHGEPDWKEIEPVVTGADGVFAFDVPETLPYQFALSCHAPGRLSRSDRYDTEIPGGSQHELGDVPLQRGAEVSGIVRDEAGAPVAGIQIYCQNLPMEIRPGQGAGDSAGAESAEDGTFHFGDALPAGTWPVRLYAETCTLAGPESVTIEAGLAPVYLEVRVRNSPSIAGVLVDENGQPVARASVQAVRNTGGRMESAWTDSKGAFRVHRQRDSEDPVILEVDDGGVERTRSSGTFAWGTDGVRLQARRLLSIPILVREKGSGAPIEDFALRCNGTHANSSDQTDLRLGGKHAGGSLTVDEVAHGENVLLVIPRDAALLPNAPLTFTAPWEKDEPLVVELERLVPLRLRLVSREGRPLAESSAALLDQALPEHSRLRDLDPRGGTSSIGWHRGRPGPALWSRGEAGEDGELELYLPANAPNAVVAVEGAHPRHVQEIARPLDQAQPLVITVSSGASVRGKLIHPLAGGGAVGVRAVPEGRRSYGDDPWMTAADGSFEGLGLAAGKYALHLAMRVDYQDPSGSGSGGWIELQPALAQIELAADEAREIVLDASSFAPGTFSGRVAIPEATASGLAVSLMLMPPGDNPRGNASALFGAFIPDVGRNFRAENLPPGSYEAQASWKSADGTVRILRSCNRIEVNAGGNVSGTFEFKRLKLRLRVVDAAGNPLPGVQVDEGYSRYEAAQPMLTDAEGWVEFDWVNHGSKQFRVGSDPPRSLAAVEVRADQDVTTVEARALTREERTAEREATKGGG